MSYMISHRFGEVFKPMSNLLRQRLPLLENKGTLDKRQELEAKSAQPYVNECPPLREVSEDELKQIIQAHQEWLQSDKKEGKRASFRRANLKNANLCKADLRYADFNRTNLQEVNLRHANLYKANLRHAELQAADLQSAILEGADLTDAKLTQAKLLNATLREACMQDAHLTEVTGLTAEQLAGSNVSGAKLPPDIAKFEGLAYIRELSQQSRNVFLAIVGGCMFSWLTVATTTDVALLTNSASSPLPIIQAKVPIVWFYWAAPVILLGLYFYLHLYLQRIWEGLAGLPAIFPDGCSLNERAYPWLLNSIARVHVALLKADGPSLSWLQVYVSIVSAWLLVPFTVFVFWLRYLPRHDLWGSIFLVIVFSGATWIGTAFYWRAQQTLRGANSDSGIYSKARGVILLSIVAILTSAISSVAISNPYVANANLREVDVSAKPRDWRGKEAEIGVLRGASLNGRDLRHADAVRAFMVKTNLRKTNLEHADLKEAQLQGAILRKANLQGANLLKANLSGAKLLEANLQNANLLEADLSGAKLRGANLQDAKGLTQKQLDKACGNKKTKLPPGLSIKSCSGRPQPLD